MKNVLNYTQVYKKTGLFPKIIMHKWHAEINS